MNTSELIREVTRDAMKGDLFPLMGMIDYLVIDEKYSLERVIKFGTRTLHLPEEKILDFLFMCGFIKVN